MNISAASRKKCNAHVIWNSDDKTNRKNLMKNVPQKRLKKNDSRKKNVRPKMYLFLNKFDCIDGTMHRQFLHHFWPIGICHCSVSRTLNFLFAGTINSSGVFQMRAAGNGDKDTKKHTIQTM